MSPVVAQSIVWPDGKRFAFTVFDDTDLMTLANGPVVYDFLHRLGFRTTKSVWPIQVQRTPTNGGSTCAEPGYRDWAFGLQQQGFEIGLHGVSSATADREETKAGLEEFRDIFGTYPACHANHADSCGIYWGDARLTGANRLLYRALNRFRRDSWEGHVPDSPLFWGDLCREHIKYVRNFVFGDINTLKSCPYMPYHDPERPWVNRWFASSEGPDVESFLRMISDENQDRLEAEGGACIMYAHFAFGFGKDGVLDPRFERAMERLASKPGWFVPVSTLLDHIAEQRGGDISITPAERRRLERSWLRHKIRVRGTT